MTVKGSEQFSQNIKAKNLFEHSLSNYLQKPSTVITTWQLKCSQDWWCQNQHATRKNTSSLILFSEALVRDGTILMTLIDLALICSSQGPAVVGGKHCAPATHLDSSCLSCPLSPVAQGQHASLITLIALVKHVSHRHTARSQCSCPLSPCLLHRTCFVCMLSENI